MTEVVYVTFTGKECGSRYGMARMSPLSWMYGAGRDPEEKACEWNSLPWVKQSICDLRLIAATFLIGPDGRYRR